MKDTASPAARQIRLAVPLLVYLALALLAVFTPLQPYLWLIGAWLAVAATVLGVRRYRPAERISWFLVAGLLASWGGWGLISAVAPDAMGLASAVGLFGQVCCAGLVLRLLWIRRSANRTDVKKARSGWFPGAVEEFSRPYDRFLRFADVLLLAGVCGLIVAQVLTTARHQPTGVSAVTAILPAGKVVLAGVLVHLLVSRDRLPRATVLGVTAALLSVVQDLVLGSGTEAPFQQYVGELATLAVLWIFVWIPLEPSMTKVFAPAEGKLRSESSRLLSLMPVITVPVLLYVIGRDDAGRLPSLVYVLAAVLAGAVALARAAAAVLDNERLAVRDWYTGLLNRRGLALAFRATAPQVREPWLMTLIDVDDFKQVNDTFGHHAGDELLVQVARRLRQSVGAEAVISRTGGDEFVLLLPPGHASVETTVSQVFSAPFTVAGHSMPVRASAGVTRFDGGADEAEVFTEVDIALYAAKAAGKNAVLPYDPKHREQVLGRQKLIDDLRRTLDGDTSAGTFEVDYQPLVELGTGLITGCEALIRWRHRRRGLVRPDEFFALAETSGMAGDLDRWVLLEALHQVAAWEAEGIGSIYVSVNLGRTSMLDPQLADVTLESLRHTGVRPQQLHLEITEHDELPPEAGALTLALLTEAGVRVSLDDFGIGYTSLNYLHRYPVRQLKLDRSITSNLQTSPSSPLLEGIVALARSLQVDVVAEGIETEPQRERLADLGIAYGQGYHLCRPQPAAAMTALLREAGPAKRIAFPREPVAVDLPA
ncbi:bifunctional diguanylate cyclase/phosphodiesterase [Kineosporia rhizophila]|uniref:putative bifunctional diguanylate cyclase/phosphodiesterase n=1 Tax=Kineosporia rhizophila TaxID=84633 RepID=UPI001E2F3204|nr:bifunctional diguanylate cyclase/phosphodiesterase [Kineosporia rhizophila]MCE0538671.1 bifunctional diguanylate cyclase/phosphodiesterase [Kineosporia rhizophila]